MAEQVPERRTLMDLYSQTLVNGATSRIMMPAIHENNFAIKPSLIQLVQKSGFGGLPHEDPYAHILNFLMICDTVKYNGVTDDALRLRLFPFSLKDKAWTWWHYMPKDAITTWEALARRFFAKYFPPAKTAKFRDDIIKFYQQDGESLYEAWERYTDLLRRCPHHDLQAWLQVESFYKGLEPTCRSKVDAAAGGALMTKTPEAAYELLEKMASSTFQWSTEKIMPGKIAGVYEVDANTSIQAQLAALTQEVGQLRIKVGKSIVECTVCGGNHSSVNCQVANTFAQAEYVSNFQKENNPYLNNYNPEWRNHPNFSGGNNQEQVRSQQQFLQEEKSALEELLMQNIKKTDQGMNQVEQRFQQFMSRAEQHMKNTDIAIQNNTAAIHNLGMQMSPILNMLSERNTKSLPINTITDPIKQAKTIQLRSGKEYADPDVQDSNQAAVGTDTSEEKTKEAETQKSKGMAARKAKEELVENHTPSKYDPPIPLPQWLPKNRGQTTSANGGSMMNFPSLGINQHSYHNDHAVHTLSTAQHFQ